MKIVEIKKIIAATLVISFALTLNSCVVAVKKVPVGTMGSFSVIKAGHPVKMFRNRPITEKKGFRTIAPGKKVRVLKMDCPAALITVPNGDTGWIKCKFIK